MLMLVVTIIIAAVVSAFAGGLGSSQKSVGQMSISGTYSQANGMTITDTGGDTIPLSSINFMTTPSEMFGTDAGKFAWVINKTIIIDPASGNPIYNATSGLYSTRAFKPGDTFKINLANCTDYWAGDFNSTPWATSYGSITKGSSSYWSILTSSPGVNENARVQWSPDNSGKVGYLGSYAFSNPANAGMYFYLDVVDTSGKVLARAKVPITK
jgi:hypothetical protein